MLLDPAGGWYSSGTPVTFTLITDRGRPGSRHPDGASGGRAHSLGFQQQALARNGRPVTVTANGDSIAIDNAASMPAGLEGYLSVALELNLIDASYTVTQGPYDLQPTVHATFKPARNVTRGE